MRLAAIAALLLLAGCQPSPKTIASCRWEVERMTPPPSGPILAKAALRLCMGARGYEMVPGGWDSLEQPESWQSTNSLARSWRAVFGQPRRDDPSRQ